MKIFTEGTIKLVFPGEAVDLHGSGPHQLPGEDPSDGRGSFVRAARGVHRLGAGHGHSAGPVPWRFAGAGRVHCKTWQNMGEMVGNIGEVMGEMLVQSNPQSMQKIGKMRGSMWKT